MWTVALSGPERSRAKAEVALEQAGIPILAETGPCSCGCEHADQWGRPAGHHALMNWRSKFPDDPKGHGWITVECEDINVPGEVVASAKWRVRVHYQAPDPPAPDPSRKLAATIAEMQAEIAALKANAKVGG